MIIDRINDTIISLAQEKPVLITGRFLISQGARVIRESFNARYNPAPSLIAPTASSSLAAEFLIRILYAATPL